MSLFIPLAGWNFTLLIYLIDGAQSVCITFDK